MEIKCAVFITTKRGRASLPIMILKIFTVGDTTLYVLILPVLYGTLGSGACTTPLVHYLPSCAMSID